MPGRTTPNSSWTGAGSGPRRPSATVLVPTTGRGAFLRDSVRSVASALGPDDELIVVEAVSSTAEGALAALGAGPWRPMHVDRPGKSRQLNAGIRAARGEVVVVTDDDCRVAENWLEGMLAPFLEPEVGIAFGPVRGLSEIPGRAAGPPSHIPGPAPTAVWRYSHGPALAVRTTAAAQVGGFDERLGPGAPAHGEEADLVLRLTACGWRCWLADAPVVEHLEWRTEAEDARNRLVFERGAGAWLGAAFRRQPLRALNLLRLRLRYQLGLFRSGGGRAHARSALIAFGSGLATGLQMKPKPSRSAPAADRRQPPRVALPWPALRGRRCLYLGARADQLASELERRGPAELVFRKANDALGGLSSIRPGEFDVVVSNRVLSSAADPQSALAALDSVCSESLLSIEPMDLGASLLARARALLRRGRAPTRPDPVRSGLGHRRLLESAGFVIQLASKPFVEQGTRVRAILCRRPRGAP